MPRQKTIQNRAQTLRNIQNKYEVNLWAIPVGLRERRTSWLLRRKESSSSIILFQKETRLWVRRINTISCLLYWIATWAGKAKQAQRYRIFVFLPLLSTGAVVYPLQALTRWRNRFRKSEKDLQEGATQFVWIRLGTEAQIFRGLT